MAYHFDKFYSVCDSKQKNIILAGMIQGSTLDLFQQNSVCDLLQKYYGPIMLQHYWSNRLKFPNPNQIIRILRLQIEKPQSTKKIFAQSEISQKNTVTCSKLYLSNIKTQKSFSSISQVYPTKNSTSNQENMHQAYDKIKRLFTPLLEQYGIEAHEFVKWITVSDEKLPEVLFSCIKNIIDRTDQNTRRTEENTSQYFYNKFKRVGKSISRDLQQEKKQQCQKMHNKIDGLILEVREIERQKNQFQAKQSKAHVKVIEKSSMIEKFRDKIQSLEKKINILEKRVLQSQEKSKQIEEAKKQAEILRLELSSKNETVLQMQIKHKEKMQKFVSEWKVLMQKLVDQTDAELRLKNKRIEELELKVKQSTELGECDIQYFGQV